MNGTQISFPATKRDHEFAKLWLGVIGIVFVVGIFAEDFEKWVLPLIFVMFVFGVHYFNKSVWGVADNVHDHGDYLIVSKSNKSVNIPIIDISNVRLTYPNHKHLITLELYQPSDFGQTITFRAHAGYPTFSEPQILKELQSRVTGA